MATIQQAVQVMVDKLVADMNGSTPLSAEEQTLVTNAIARLTDNAKLEQAVVAVAQEHLDDSTQLLQQVATSAINNIDSAKADLTASTAELVTRAAKLALLDQIGPLTQQINEVVANNTAATPKTLFAIKNIDTANNNVNFRRSTSVLAIYNSDGTSYLTRPSYTANAATDTCRLDHLQISQDGTSSTVLKSSFVHNNAFEQNPATKVYQHGASAIVPLGLKAQPNDVSFEIVYSTQESLSANATEYGGIFVLGQGFTSRTLPKQNLNAQDKFGIPTRSSYNHNEVAVLYNNQKHCLVVVDSGTNLVVEKYRDGNHITNIAIANATEYQSYVDNGDFTTMVFIANTLAQPHGINRYNHSEAAMSSYSYNYYGYFGLLGSEVKMAGDKFNAHYLFTEEQKLQPINYIFTSNSEPYRTQSSNGTENSEGEVNVVMETLDGELLSSYCYRSKADSLGYDGGVIATAIQAMNPYSHIGVINEHYLYNQYGLARTCRAI
ncbi:hypothetical protein [Pseudoalteromonas maricaloris]|uniref:hypothetical protein n=1 Tax=Pseudoalteromonas maricaloris TaxID=184924 RepID=UPI00057E93DE|nr:hypothetical protein [Pseudoalteromonas flavipulchra]KID34298.1 hypothetical protein QT15_18000 [Pseudoalteromonas flavipulchra NCIMB 2033 = ATCC BAA-314]MBD0784607.1 hypothetical protein [Pseudoalteromonas flavipulchra]MBE0372059.1 hypothetical protein [Pseudoalteromonas flavipulchra NCIMB 2033 = ATCC BAA-314]